MSRIANFIENNLFKKRIFFVADKKTPFPDGILDNPYFRAEIIKNAEDLSQKVNVSNLIKHDLVEKFRKRLENPSFTLYLAIDKSNSEVAGFFWTAEAKKEPIWHDKIYAEPNSVLGFNAFTFPEYRGKNAFPFIFSIAIKNTVQQRDLNCHYTIVEISNKASIRAHEKVGLKAAGENYLVKVCGMNIFSIIHRNDKWEIHFVFRSSKSKSL